LATPFNGIVLWAPPAIAVRTIFQLGVPPVLVIALMNNWTSYIPTGILVLVARPLVRDITPLEVLVKVVIDELYKVTAVALIRVWTRV
jgi:hypothetical protein